MPADPLPSLLEQSLPADALLYHYTKATGLLGIVNERTDDVGDGPEISK